jgi:hypothetical protein
MRAINFGTIFQTRFANVDARAAHMRRCSRAERQNGFADKVIDEAAEVRLASRPAPLPLAQYTNVQRSDWGHLIVTLI